MGTTPNYSWPYPESSDYVADGATAIENLADAADASLGAFTNRLGASGTIVYIGDYANGATLSAVDLNRLNSACILDDQSYNVPNASETIVSFGSGTELYDIGWHSTSTNPTRITPSAPGLYLATGKYTGGSSSINLAFSRFRKNGSVVVASVTILDGPGINGAHFTAYYVTMNGTTDYLEYAVYQNSGNSRTGQVQFGLFHLRTTT